MLENYPIDTISWNSSNYIHLLTEVERRAYADRAEHMGDPEFWDVPISMLTSKEYAKSRIKNIDLNNYKLRILKEELYVLNLSDNISTKFKDKQKYYADCVKKDISPIENFK